MELEMGFPPQPCHGRWRSRGSEPGPGSLHPLPWLQDTETQRGQAAGPRSPSKAISPKVSVNQALSRASFYRSENRGSVSCLEKVENRRGPFMVWLPLPPPARNLPAVPVAAPASRPFSLQFPPRGVPSPTSSQLPPSQPPSFSSSNVPSSRRSP